MVKIKINRSFLMIETLPKCINKIMAVINKPVRPKVSIRLKKLIESKKRFEFLRISPNEMFTATKKLQNEASGENPNDRAVEKVCPIFIKSKLPELLTTPRNISKKVPLNRPKK